MHLAAGLSGLFASRTNGWFPPFTEAITDLTAAQASWRHGEGFHTIWEIVNHVRFWHEVVPLQRNTEPWQLLHGLIAHTAYHTAQIIMLRRLQGIWIVDWRERAKKIY